MESGDIITEKKDEKSSEIFDELQQKKLFAEKELEIKSQEEEKKEEKTQENTLADITEEKVLSAEENLKIEEEKIEVQETSINNESEKEEVNLKETTESEIVSEEPEEEKKDEIIVENVVAENLEEKRDPKDITILTDNDDVRLVESGLEIQYTSLHLNNFPISYSNFSNELSFNEVISVGTSTVKIGETLLNNTSLKILVYDKFKLLEIKTREFKVALSIDLLNGETLVKNGDFYKYEIFNKIKNSRFVEVVNILKEIFSGAKIEFKFKKLVGDITFENRIEVYKFNLLQELANSYKNIVNSFSLNREKNFAEITNSFYEVFLTEAILENKKIDSWINFRIKNSFDIQAGDNLTFERVHKLDFRGINFDIKEIIKVKSEVSEREFTKDNEICGYRKAVEISLEKVEKFN